MKLTEKQRLALSSMPFAYLVWGGGLIGGLPEGIKSRRTLEALSRKGLAFKSRDKAIVTWRPTPAGRALLAEEKQDA